MPSKRNRYRATIPVTLEVDINSVLLPEEVLGILLEGMASPIDPQERWGENWPLVIEQDGRMVAGLANRVTLAGKIVLEEMKGAPPCP